MKNIYDYVTEELSAFKKPITIADGWSWNFPEHVRRIFLYKNSQFERENENRDKRPFNNIIRPIQNVRYRTEGFDVKDVELYVNNPDKYYKSFLVRKYHEKWALEHELDNMIDDIVESSADYDFVLVKDIPNDKPIVIEPQAIAFCDQSSVLSAPFGIEHNMSPNELREMSKVGWGSKGATISIEELIAVCEKNREEKNYSNSTPGKFVKVYEVHGTLPKSWLNREESYDYDEVEYVNQVQIIAFYKNAKDQDVGVTLFASREPSLPFKVLIINKVKGRAMGSSGIEELLEPQVWTNFSEVQILEMLELASKIFFKTTDSRFKTRNNIANKPTGSVFDLQAGTDIGQLDTSPKNIAIFNNNVDRWEQRGRTMGAAGEPLLGESPSSGTPFKLFEAQLIEGKSLHLWRKGKIATFVDEIYRDWIIPKIQKEIIKGKKFLAELSMDELQEVVQSVARNKARKQIMEEILSGELPSNEEELVQKFQQELARGGSKRFIQILKDEFADEELDVRTNIAGKNKNLAMMTDKLVGVLRQFISTPQLRQDPEMMKFLNNILEFSGLSPIMFASSAPGMTMEGQQGAQPLQQLSQPVEATA